VVKLRWIWLLCVAVGIVGSSISLVADREPAWVCCANPGDCGQSQVCCSETVLGMPSCDDDNPGYCVTVCSRVGG
jgi:hypothetical protein